ncbi:MAG: ABC transporter permease, partial [Candidatus Gastranaerophilales bacterium]|nr:ABC transporter permease [Candidatus Gastranaerophilales bacterium]
MPILAYILKRILQAIPLLVIVSILSFVVIKMSPVDPLAELKMNPAISPETLQAEKVRLGLDLPVHEQYFRWAGNFIRGDLGVSTSGEKVIDRLVERIPNT